VTLKAIIEVGEEQLDQVGSLLEVDDVIHHIEHSPALHHLETLWLAA
jgi:hypothetical protein